MPHLLFLECMLQHVTIRSPIPVRPEKVLTFNFGIPAGTEDLDAFVRHPESRPPLQISAELRVPDETDLFAFDLARIEKLCEDCGMFFQNLDMYNTDQEFSSLWSRETYTKQFGRIEKEGLQLHCVLRRREDR